MGAKHAAQHAFWELVEDYGEWTIHQLASHQDKAPLLVSKVLSVAVTGGHLIKAVAHANKGEWDKAADSCSDMAGAALNFISHGEFGAAKGLVWDTAMAAHIASGKHGEMFSEVQHKVLHDLGQSFGNKVFEFLHPISISGSQPNLAEYYERHSELYRPHYEAGKLHFDRLIPDATGQKHPAHFNYLLDSGDRVAVAAGKYIEGQTVASGTERGTDSAPPPEDVAAVGTIAVLPHDSSTLHSPASANQSMPDGSVINASPEFAPVASPQEANYTASAGSSKPVPMDSALAPIDEQGSATAYPIESSKADDSNLDSKPEPATSSSAAVPHEKSSSSVKDVPDSNQLPTHHSDVDVHP